MEGKVALLRRHLVDKVPVSDICNEQQLQPSVFYARLKQAMENLGGALMPPASSGPSEREKKLASENTELKARLAKKDGVIAEVSAEYVQPKMGEA